MQAVKAAGRRSLRDGGRDEEARSGTNHTMPTLIRFVVVCAVLAGIGFGCLYVLAVYFEPEPKEISKSIRGIKLRPN